MNAWPGWVQQVSVLFSLSVLSVLTCWSTVWIQIFSSAWQVWTEFEFGLFSTLVRKATSFISKYSCSVFKERYKNMPWTKFPFTCVVSCSIGLGTEQKHGGFRQSCCEPGNKLIGNRLIYTYISKNEDAARNLQNLLILGGLQAARFAEHMKCSRGDHDQIWIAYID